MNRIDERLQEIARSVFDDESLVLSDETVASDVPGWDSLAHVSFMYALEQEFGVEFSEDEFTGFADIGDLKRTVLTKSKE